MRGCGISLILLLCIWLHAGLVHAAGLTPREQILKHFSGLDAGWSGRSKSFQSIRDMETNAIPVLIEMLACQESLIDELYGKTYLKAPPAIRLEALNRVRREASSLLLNMRATDLYLKDLLPLMKDTRVEVRSEASSLIASKSYRADKNFLSECLPYLKDSDPAVRKNIAITFTFNRVANWTGELPEAKAALETALSDPAEEVRLHAAYALLRANKEHEAAITTLKTLFASTNANTRYFAAFYYLVSDSKQPRAEEELLPVFIATLAVDDSSLPRLASETLGKFYGTRAKTAVPELQRLMQSPDFELRKAAWGALQKIAPEIVLPMPEAELPPQSRPVVAAPAARAPRDQVLKHLADIYSTNQAVAFRSIQAMGSNAVPTLIEVLGYEDSQAVKFLEKAHAKAPAAIRQAIAKPELVENLRNQASLCLFNMPDAKLYLTNLFPLLQDARPVVRQQAASLISAYAYQTDKKLLLEVLFALKDTDPRVRREIAWSLRNGASALPRVRSALEPLLNDPVDDVKFNAADALLQGDTDHEGALRMLKSMMTSTNDMTRLRAATHYVRSAPKLTRTDDDLLPLFLNALSSKDDSVRYGAAGILGLYGKRAQAAVPELQKMLIAKEYEERELGTNTLRMIAPEVLVPKRQVRSEVRKP